MIDPYRMVLVNLASLSIICLGIFIYRFVYPKKRPRLFPLLIIFSLLPVISILRKGVYESGDFNMHIYRAMMFYENIKQGILMPSWGGELNATYGYPVFAFNYILHYYVIALFHFIGFSFVAGMKLFLILSLIGSGITMFLWAKKLFKNELAAFTAAVFYMFAPYHLMTLHFRVNGENFAYALAPLLFYQLHNLVEKQSGKNILFFGLLLGLLFFAHSANAAFCSLFMIAYLGLLYLTKAVRSRKAYLAVLAGYIIGVALASPVFFAHLNLSQYTYGYVLAGKPSFTPLWQLLFSPWRMGLLFQGPRGEFAFIIGYTQIFVLLLMIYLAFRKKVQKKNTINVIFWMVITIFIAFLITPQSWLLWKIIPILSFAQFSYRLLFFVNIATAILAGYLVLTLPKRKTAIYILILATIAYTGINWGNRRTIPEIADDTLRKNIPLSSWNYEGMAVMASPRWLDINNLWEKKVPDKHLQIVNGDGQIKHLRREQTYHAYIVNTKEKITMRENTLYFPGWSVNVDNKPVAITYTDKKSLGKMLFTLSPGLHFVEVIYKDIPLYAATKIISLFGFVSITIFLLLQWGFRKLYYEKKPLR